MATSNPVSKVIVDFAKQFQRYSNEFSNFLVTFESFSQAFIAANPPGNPPGPPKKGKQDDPGSVFKQIKSAFTDNANKYFGELTELIDRFSKIQIRAFASNTSLDQIKVSTKLGVSIADLTEEILSFREQGVTQLTESTMGLIQRMKLTGQSTEGLRRLVGQNSLSLLMNTRESQGLAASISEYALTYGIRQDAMFDVVNNLSKSLEVPALLGFGDDIALAASKLSADLGGRANDQVQKLAQFLTDPGKLAAIQNLGVRDLVDQLIAGRGTVDQNVDLLKQISEIASSNIERATASLREQGTAGITQANQILEVFGGQQALVFSQLDKAAEESRKASSTNVDFTQGLYAFFQEIKIGLEGVAKFVNELLIEFKPIMKPLAKFISIALPVLAGIGAIMAIISLGIPGIIAGVVGLTGAILTSGEESNQNLKEINRKTEDKTYQYRDQEFGIGLMGALNNTLMNIVSGKDYGDRNLEVSQKILEEMKSLNKTVITGDGVPSKASTNLTNK